MKRFPMTLFSMNRLIFLNAIVCLSAGLVLTGCGKTVTAQENASAATGAPPAQDVETEIDYNNLKVEHPDQFPTVQAGEHMATPELNVTGQVLPDVSKQVQVPSLATGRVIEIDARLGDEVKKGQMLFKVRSTDISGAYSDYRQAVKNEELTKIQLDRAKLLFEARRLAQKRARDRGERRGRQRRGARHHRRTSEAARRRTRIIQRRFWKSTLRCRAPSRIRKSSWRLPFNLTIRPPHSPFPICRTYGSSATCRKTICRECV